MRLRVEVDSANKEYTIMLQTFATCFTLACLASAIAVRPYGQTTSTAPQLRRQGTATQLIVDGKPFLALTLVQFLSFFLAQFFTAAFQLLDFDLHQRTRRRIPAHDRVACRRPCKHKARIVCLPTHRVVPGSE